MKVLVTGGGGFLGKGIVRLLVERGVDVRSFARGVYPDLQALGVTAVQGDLDDPRAVNAAVEGCDIVFHVAAKAGIWGDYEDYYRTNVRGTANIIAGCRKHRVRRLVYTSSPSVVFAGRDIEGGDESLPYPDGFTAPYPHTKALAEQQVLAANDAELATVALRPHLIWGPGDNHLVPRIIERGKRGRLFRIGYRPCPVDSVYIDNAVDAHILAAGSLNIGGTTSGKAYFISNGEPLPLWQLVNRILDAAGLPPADLWLPASLACCAGSVLEKVYGTLRIKKEPPLTRFLAHELSTAHWFDITAARRDLGYAPAVSIEEGMQRLAAWFQSEQAA